MGVVANFDINLSNPTGIYKPGEILSGQVIVKLKEDTAVHGIYLWVLGQSDVSWAEKSGGPRDNFEYEVYMKDCLILWGRDPRDQGPDQGYRLPTGGHEYNFQYSLPRSLPSTFESQGIEFKSRVHYMLRAKLDSPDDSVRQHRDKVFLVLSQLDLNTERQASESVQLRKDKYTCWCCSRSGPITCTLRLDRTGFVPGEDINVDAEIANLSRKEITASYVTMQQIIRVHAHGTSKSSSSDIFRISGGKIRSGDSAFFHDIIHIPPLPPSRLDGCRIIDIEYVITVGVIPSGIASPVEISVPIIVGTRPLTRLLQDPSAVSPSFSRYSHSSGEIEDYVEDDYQKGKIQHVYTYYKQLYQRQNETLSSNAIGNH